MAAARSHNRHSHSHSDDAKNDGRGVSFIDYASSDRSGNCLGVLHAIFNSANTNVIELMVTPHGEIYVGPDGTAPQQLDSGVKISTINFARPGVVNWSDDTVNKIALKTIERFATNEHEFQNLLDILTTGTAPNPPPFGLSVDEIIFACTLRIMYLLEKSDRVHQGRMTYKIRNQEDLLPGSESLGATEHSFTLNFFTNRPMTTQRNLVPGESPDQSLMTEEFGTLCIDIFKGKTTQHSRLEMFSKLLQDKNVRIVLPTVVQLPKLYTLSRDEHRSRYKSTTPALVIPSKVRKEKGLEHKVVALSKLPPNIVSRDAFISYVSTVLRNMHNINCYNWMVGDKRGYKNVKVPHNYFNKITDLPGVFDDQFKEDINDPSTFWNKLCIIFSLHGTTKGALVQWRIHHHLGVPHLVFNIWNLISGKAKISQTTQEAGYSTATTYDIMKFVRDIFKGNITRILDITCQVEGGLPNTAWIVSKDPLGAENIFKSRILSLHPSGTRAITPRTSTNVALSDFISGLGNISTIFDACRDDSSLIKLTSLVSAPPTTHHLNTSEQSSFLSVVPVLSKLLDDPKFNNTGISSFGVSLELKLLKQNPDIAQQVKINDTHDLRQFGICVCRYIRDMAYAIYRFIPPLKSDSLNRDMVSELHRLLELFHDAIYYLNIKQSTFVIHQTGSFESDLRLSHATVALKPMRKTFNRLETRLEKFLEGHTDRGQKRIKEEPEYRKTQSLLKNAESNISNLLEKADEYDSAVGPLNRVSKTLHNVAHFTYDDSPSPKVAHIKQKRPGIIATIRAIIAYCNSLQPPPVGGPGGGGGSRNNKKYKSRKTKWSRKRKTRNRLSYRRRRIVVNTTKRK